MKPMLVHLEHPGHMGCSRLLLYPILRTIFHRACHVANSHPPVKVAPTSQGRTHQSRSHSPVKVAYTSQSRIPQQGLIHQSRSHPPVKVTPTGQSRTHQARRLPPFQVAPTSQDRFATWRALCHSIVGSACPAMHSTNRNLPYASDPACICLLYTSPSPRDRQKSRMPSSA